MDIGTAKMVGKAVPGALFARTRDGEGQYVEMGLFDTALPMTGWVSMQHLMTSVPHQRHGNTGIDTCPPGVFQSKDQAFCISRCSPGRTGRNACARRVQTGQPSRSALKARASGASTAKIRTSAVNTGPAAFTCR